MSTQIDLGPVLSIPKGDWNATTVYERLNIVRHNSASWICNVATSQGVEPTEGSTDWYLQVKDTSSVSSVNGMRGDVEITTIQTPSNDSNDTSIANTEWVRDRIDETVDNVHSYTDSVISTATTSILNTAAQDASNKATTAVNQALAASETKFATKEVTNNLINDINTLIADNAAQDVAISSVQDSANTISQQVVSLDSSLRTLIAQEVAKCLKTSGGTLTGIVRQSVGDIMTATRDDMWTSIKGGSEHNRGAALILYGQDHGGNGHAELSAYKEGVGGAMLNLSPTGVAVISGNTVLTSAGGTMTGAFVNATLTRNNLSGQTEIYGGTTGSNGAYIALYGQSCTEGYGGGSLLLRAANKGTVTDVTIDPGDGMYVGGKEVICIASEWHDSSGNWYIKYSNGFIMQAGRTSKRPPIANSKWAYQADFHIPFATTQYIVEHGATSFSNDASGAHATENIATTYCYIYEATYIRSGEARWFACGY